MDEFINKMAERVGIDRATAEKVVQFLKEHADELPKILAGGGGVAGIMDRAGDLFGGSDLFGKKEQG